MLTDSLTEKELSRLFDYFDWSATEEGSWFLSWGEEGVTYSLDANGKAQVLPKYSSAANPSGENLTLSLIYHQDYIPNRDMGAVISTSGTTNIELTNSFSEKKYKGYKQLNFVFDADTQETINTLYTVIDDMRKEYSNKFVMGLLNPNSDSDWQSYVSDLKKSGLDEWSKYYTDYYNKNLS